MERLGPEESAVNVRRFSVFQNSRMTALTLPLDRQLHSARTSGRCCTKRCSSRLDSLESKPKLPLTGSVEKRRGGVSVPAIGYL